MGGINNIHPCRKNVAPSGAIFLNCSGNSNSWVCRVSRGTCSRSGRYQLVTNMPKFVTYLTSVILRSARNIFCKYLLLPLLCGHQCRGRLKKVLCNQSY